MPIGSDLVLHEQPDPAAARLDGQALGRVIVEAARRYQTPLAFPLMDLQIEKEDLLLQLGVAPEAIDQFHFDEDGPSAEHLAAIRDSAETAPPTPRMKAGAEAIACVAQYDDLVAMGMCIGPFSLLAKLIDDPITMLYSAIAGDEDDDEALIVTRTLELATLIILRSLRLQIAAGAKAVCVCEPACNLVYLSPNQLKEDPGILERFVLRYNREIKALFDQHGVDLVFHDCGELSDSMIEAFGALDPAILSLGSPVDLPHAASLVPRTTVLFGNLPSKKFYSDAEYPADAVARDAASLRERMAATGHPFILGTECDVLCVKGCEHRIKEKVSALLSAAPQPSTTNPINS